MKFEIERQMQRGPWRGFWSSTSGLLLALVLVVAIAMLMWSQGRMSPEERFAEGVRLLELAEPDWRTARDKYLSPLVAEDPGAWDERVAPYLQRIEQLSIESRSRPTRRLQVGDSGEVTRFLRLAREYKRLGDRPRAIRILESVLELVNGQPRWESEAEVARGLLEEWRVELPDKPGEAGLAAVAIERASLAQKGGRIEEARRVWHSILDLYAGDARFQDAVTEARRGLAETEDER